MWAARVVSAIGILGLALSATFLFAVYLAFKPGHAELTYFFVGRSDRELSLVVFGLAAVPYVLLLMHLYLRTHLGDWYLRRGRTDLVKRYVQPRLKISLARSATEVAYLRLSLAKACIRERDYRAALDVLQGAQRVPRRLQLEFLRWTLEAALRVDDLVTANRVVERLRPEKSKVAGQAWAAAAELAVRQGDEQAYQQALQNAQWAAAGDDRLTFSRWAWARKFSKELPESKDVTKFLHDVPGATLEWLVLQGIADERACADARSRWCYETSKTEGQHDAINSGR